MKRTRLNIYVEYPNSMIESTINEWIHSERDRRILRYKLIDGLTYERIAELEDMSPRRIQNIVYAAEDRLFKHFIVDETTPYKN